MAVCVGSRVNHANRHRSTRAIARRVQRHSTSRREVTRRSWGDGESLCKRDSVRTFVCGDHPSMRSTRRSPCGGRAAHSFCLTLLLVGFTKPRESPHVLVRSYRTVSALPVIVADPSAVSSLLHCPSGCPDLARASTMLCGVPTFLDVLLHRSHPNDSPSRGSVRVVRACA